MRGVGYSDGSSSSALHLLQGEDLYHFGVFKGSYRVARAEAEAAIQLAAGWFIKMHTHEGVAVSFG